MKHKIESFLKNERVGWSLIITLFSLMGIHLIMQGPVLNPDTPSYLDMDPRRSVGYPLFLYIFRIFGDNYLNIVILVQMILNIAAVIAFFHFLKEQFNLNIYYLLILIPPLWYEANNVLYPVEIGTEALAFPLFLFVVIYYLKSVLNRNYRHMLTAMLINLVLILVRAQFLYMFPAILLGLFHIYIYDRHLMRFIKYAAILVLLYPAFQLIDSTYHYIFHGKFITSPFGSNGIAANALYVAQKEDYQLFEDETVKELYKEIYQSIYRDTLNLASYQDSQNRSGLYVSDVSHYSASFNEILHRTTTPILQAHFDHLDGIESWQAIENKLEQIKWPLMKANWKEFTLINFVYSIVVRGFPTQFALITFIFLFICSAIGVIHNNKYAIMLFYFSLFHSLHFILVGMGGRILSRYSFYTEFLLFTIIIIGIIYLCSNKNNLLTAKQ